VRRDTHTHTHIYIYIYVVRRLRVNVLLTCIIVYQYSETNLTHFLFNLLTIKGLYMFRALPARPQEGVTQAALCILRECYVSWLHQD
jgi:hypothetical protein